MHIRGLLTLSTCQEAADKSVHLLVLLKMHPDSCDADPHNILSGTYMFHIYLDVPKIYLSTVYHMKQICIFWIHLYILCLYMLYIISIHNIHIWYNLYHMNQIRRYVLSGYISACYEPDNILCTIWIYQLPAWVIYTYRSIGNIRACCAEAPYAHGLRCYVEKIGYVTLRKDVLCPRRF